MGFAIGVIAVALFISWRLHEAGHRTAADEIILWLVSGLWTLPVVGVLLIWWLVDALASGTL